MAVRARASAMMAGLLLDLALVLWIDLWFIKNIGILNREFDLIRPYIKKL